MDPLSLALDLVLPLLPEPWRLYARAAVIAVVYVVTLASLVTAQLPAWAFKRWRVLRVLSWLSALAPRDAAGTIKLPGRAPQDPGAIADLAAFRAAAGRVVDQVAPLVPAEDPAAPRVPPPTGQSGRASVGAMLALCVAVLCATMVGAVLSGCPRLPPVSGCTPRAYRCTDSGRPEVCSSTQRWEPIGDEPCAASGAVCVVDRTAHCAPMAVTP